jgi:hypothetical protein
MEQLSAPTEKIQEAQVKDSPPTQVEQNPSPTNREDSQTPDDSAKFISKLERIKKISRKASTERMLLEKQVLRSAHSAW